MCIGDALISHIIKPEMISLHLENSGWKKTNSKFVDVHVFRKGLEEVVVPYNLNFDEYESLLNLAINKISKVDNVKHDTLIQTLKLIQVVK